MMHSGFKVASLEAFNLHNTIAMRVIINCYSKKSKKGDWFSAKANRQKTWADLFDENDISPGLIIDYLNF